MHLTVTANVFLILGRNDRKILRGRTPVRIIQRDHNLFPSILRRRAGVVKIYITRLNNSRVPAGTHTRTYPSTGERDVETKG